MVVIITVNDDFVCSKRFKHLSPKDKGVVIEIGEHIYFNGMQTYNDELNKNEKELINKRIDDIKDVSKTNIQQCSDVLKDQYAYIINSKEEIISAKESEISFLRERMQKLEKENFQALSLNGKLDSLLGKGNSIHNAMKGDFGESVVSNQILKWFPVSEIEDTSGDTAKGDLLWKLNDEEFRALVEVKNVQTVRPSEVQKFERDMLINSKNNICNCGLFVSLKTESIPNKGKFKLEFINNVPVIYVSNILDDSNTASHQKK